MNSNTFIAGDWGTTRLRLHLFSGDRMVGTTTGPGIGALTEPPAQVIRTLTASWLAAHGPLPLVLCGMAGSRNGWRETPYVPCPASLDSLRAALVRFESESLGVCIVPGVSCTNRLGAPDVMRGEETQILGALALRPDLATGRHLFCLPGTHTKWVCLTDGRIGDFVTALTGELFALLRDHSMLARAGAGGAGPGDGFERGLNAVASLGGANLLHAVFAARSRQLLESVSKDWALAFLSGLLVGSDVGGALNLFGDRPGGIRQVVLIGDPALTQLYAEALRRQDIESVPVDGGECSLAGMRAVISPETR